MNTSGRNVDKINRAPTLEGNAILLIMLHSQSHPKYFSPHQILFSTMYSTMNLHFEFVSFGSFHEAGVCGRVLLSQPEFFMFVAARLILSTYNSHVNSFFIGIFLAVWRCGVFGAFAVWRRFSLERLEGIYLQS